MEQLLLPKIPDFAPVVKEAAQLVTQMSDALKTVNPAFFITGFLAGFGVCATLLTAIWAFSRGK